MSASSSLRPSATPAAACRLDLVAAGDRLAVAAEPGLPLARCAAQVWVVDLAAAHAALREVLAEHLGVAPDDVAFVRDRGGKPRVEGSRLRFNLTHSGELALVAVALDAEVGIDLERVRERRGRDAVVRRLFSTRERDALADASAGERDGLFHRLWVRKEAFVKATGEGVGAVKAVDALTWPPPGWLGCDLPVPGGYVAAVVVGQRGHGA